MKRVFEKIEKVQKAKKDVLKNIVKIVEPNRGKNVTLKIASSDHKLRWYKKKIITLAEIYGADVRLDYKKQIAIFEFGTSSMASWFRESFTK